MERRLSMGIFFKLEEDQTYTVMVRHPYVTTDEYKQGRLENQVFFKWVKKNLTSGKTGFQRHSMRWSDRPRSREHRSGYCGWSCRYKWYYPSTDDRFFMIKDVSKKDLMMIKLSWHLEEWDGLS